MTIHQHVVLDMAGLHRSASSWPTIGTLLNIWAVSRRLTWHSSPSRPPDFHQLQLGIPHATRCNQLRDYRGINHSRLFLHMIFCLKYQKKCVLVCANYACLYTSPNRVVSLHANTHQDRDMFLQTSMCLLRLEVSNGLQLATLRNASKLGGAL